MTLLVCDFETTIFNKGNFADKRNWAVSYVVGGNFITTTFKYYTDPDFINYLKQLVMDCSVFIGFQAKFDIHWLRRANIDVPAHVKIWDVQLAEFINSGQSLPFDSLDAAAERYGLPRKPDLVKEYWKQGVSTEHIPLLILEEYNIHDVETTYQIYLIQQAMLDEKQKALVFLEGEDLKTLQSAEYAGMKFDKEQAINTVLSLQSELNTIKQTLNEFIPAEATDFNWNSGDQLSALLYGGEITYDYAVSEPAVYKSGAKLGQSYIRNTWFAKQVLFPGYFKPDPDKEVAKTKSDSTAKTRFYQTDAPTLLSLKVKTKEQKTLLDGISSMSGKAKTAEMIESLLKISEEQQWGDYLHGQFNQNVVVTGRLSSSRPNLQNTNAEVDCLLVSRYD